MSLATQVLKYSSKRAVELWNLLKQAKDESDLEILTTSFLQHKSDQEVAIDDDIPLTKIVKRSALLVRGAQSQLDLPEPIIDLLEELKADLPQREFHARVKHSKTNKQKTTHTNNSHYALHFVVLSKYLLSDFRQGKSA